MRCERGFLILLYSFVNRFFRYRTFFILQVEVQQSTDEEEDREIEKERSKGKGLSKGKGKGKGKEPARPKKAAMPISSDSDSEDEALESDSNDAVSEGEDELPDPTSGTGTGTATGSDKEPDAGPSWNTGTLVVAVYEDEWFIAEILQNQDHMPRGYKRLSYAAIKGNNVFCWPTRKDLVTTFHEDILLSDVTVEPKNSRGHFGLKQKDLKLVKAKMVVVYFLLFFVFFLKIFFEKNEKILNCTNYSQKTDKKPSKQFSNSVLWLLLMHFKIFSIIFKIFEKKTTTVKS